MVGYGRETLLSLHCFCDPKHSCSLFCSFLVCSIWTEVSVALIDLLLLLC